MNKDKKIYGIDISKDVFDVFSIESGHAQFKNDEKGIGVSVVNPLSVKPFIQMKLAKVKTDKSDAKAICEYGQSNDLPLYNALTEVQSEYLQLLQNGNYDLLL